MTPVIASPVKPGAHASLGAGFLAIHARWIASTFANLSAVALAEVEAPVDTVVASLLAMTAFVSSTSNSQ